MRTFQPENLDHEEFYKTSKSINSAIARLVNEDEFIKLIRPPIDKTVNELKASLEKGSDDSLEFILAIEDSKRDLAYISFRDYVKAFSNSQEEDKMKAGKFLSDVLQDCGWELYKLDYDKQSEQVTSLFTKLDSVEGKKAIETIGAEKFVNGLKNAERKFEELYQEKVAAESEDNVTIINSARKTLTRYIEAVLSYVDINVELQPEKFSKTADKINGILKTG